MTTIHLEYMNDMTKCFSKYILVLFMFYLVVAGNIQNKEQGHRQKQERDKLGNKISHTSRLVTDAAGS